VTEAHRAYKQRVAERRRRGMERYGDRHLHDPEGPRFICRVLTEVVDCGNYLDMEIRRWQRDGGREGALDGLRELLDRAERLGRRVAHVARDLCDTTSDFERVRTSQWALGKATYGEGYYTRDNLIEALDELADAEIYLALLAARLRFEDNYPEPVQQQLVDVDDQVQDLAFAIADTQARWGVVYAVAA